MTLVRANLMVAASKAEGQLLKTQYPQFRRHLVITPRSLPSGILIGSWVWTPHALRLPARLRLAIRGALAPMIDEGSVEEEFPDTLLS